MPDPTDTATGSSPLPTPDDTVVVAMSGGVDSSVAAALLGESGCRVVGVTLRLWCGTDPAAAAVPSPAAKTCCSIQDIADAKRVAAQLGIRHYLLDLRQGFEEQVVAPFVAEYARGRTPNPCVECNTHLKFGYLLEVAEQLGAAYVATGHYARRSMADGVPAIRRGGDPGKDQSYVLWGIRRAMLERVLFPLGELDKTAVRERAAALGLEVAAKPDSQDICFVEEGRYAAFVRQRLGDQVVPGTIEDLDGNLLGRHRGIVDFTIGQRRGLGLAASQPLYVVAIEPDTQTVRVGPAAALMAQGMRVERINRLQTEPFLPGRRLAVQIRAGQTAYDARITAATGDGVEIAFDAPVRAAVPGQSAAFYDGDRLLGGGIIEAGCHR